MTDNIIRAWVLAADDNFGGSLDYDEPIPAQRPGPKAASGVPYCYAYRDGWRVRIPGVQSKCFTTLKEARSYVALYVALP